MPAEKHPNLFIIGAMKSGTTSLHSYLGTHPEIFMSDVKEPGYFCPRSKPEHTKEAYLQLFSKAGNARWLGESSTDYSKYPQEKVADSIARFSPDAKIIYLMRDPVERTISHYWHNVMKLGESRDILGAIKDSRHYCNVSNYALQLNPYIEAFGLDRIKPITFENFIANPQAAISDIFSWLGVDPSFVPPNIGVNENILPRLMIQKTNDDVKSDPAEIVPDIFSWLADGKTNVPDALKEKASKMNVRVIDRDKLDTKKAIDFLRPIQMEQTGILSGLLSRTFHEWTTLNG